MMRLWPRASPKRRPLSRALLACFGSTPRAAAHRLVDYTPYPYAVEQVHLDFHLGEETSRCTSTLQLSARGGPAPLELDGQELDTVRVALNGDALELGSPDGYAIRTNPDGDQVMEILAAPKLSAPFELQIETLLRPDENTKLEGLYRSSGTFCTQCEAQGFRRITWFPDRPDVLSKFTVRLTAPKDACPVLLSNGNLVSTEEFTLMDDGTAKEMHSSVWVDPFRKPAYLFALVAGDLVALEDSITTSPSNRNVELKIWTQSHNADKTEFAMQSLKESFLWDEKRFNLEYDLDIFQIVAVDDFNMGAMENKSLNVFNSRLVLATPDTATDIDYERIQGVVGHEYFHNWTGNRVTCRDWFQLSLKEGLTVFRDQEFTADLNSRAVKRIADVRLLRASQFPEDSGAMAHPIRPASYEKIDNFYTVTVYEKGAEVIRMYHTLLGEERFMKGMQLYFERHDGSAVTTDDFFNAMRDANPGVSALGPVFRRWYSQAGTPEVSVKWEHDDSAGILEMVVRQWTPATPDPGGDQKLPVLVPLAVGLVDKETGSDVENLRVYRVEPSGELAPVASASLSQSDSDINSADSSSALSTTHVLICADEESKFVFEGLPSHGVVPSVLRDFSAPVRLRTPQIGIGELAFLLANDSDSFNRAEAASRLMTLMIKQSYADIGEEEDFSCPKPWDFRASEFQPAIEGLRAILRNEELDASFRALVLEIPSPGEIIDMMDGPVDPLQVYHARVRVVRAIADALSRDLLCTYEQTKASEKSYVWTPTAAGNRSLSARCLKYLIAQTNPTEREHALRLAEEQFNSANNMTDSFSALAAMNNVPSDERDRCMRAFLDRWGSDNNVVVKYFSLESATDVEGSAARLRAIVDSAVRVGGEDPLGVGSGGDEMSVEGVAQYFDVTIPNHVYALCRTFPASYVNFHAEDGSGYRLLADWILQVDALNAQVGSRLAGPFTKWLSYDKGRRAIIRGELERILEVESLSPNTREIVGKSLAQGGAGDSKL